MGAKSKQNMYDDELSLEVFDLFDQKKYPSDVSNLIGGSKKEYEHMYHYWMDQKREFIKEGLIVDFVIAIEGYPTHIVGGKIVKVYQNSVLITIQESLHSEDLDNRLLGKVVVSIKDVMQRS